VRISKWLTPEDENIKWINKERRRFTKDGFKARKVRSGGLIALEINMKVTIGADEKIQEIRPA
jgi:hypothetical protein